MLTATEMRKRIQVDADNKSGKTAYKEALDRFLERLQKAWDGQRPLSMVFSEAEAVIDVDLKYRSVDVQSISLGTRMDCWDEARSWLAMNGFTIRTIHGGPYNFTITLGD